MRLIFVILSIVGISTPSLVRAEVSSYGAFLHSAELPSVLFLVGEISSGHSFELRRAMREHSIKVIVTASPGGNLYEGLQIAAIVHDNDLATYVPAGAGCESSCANVFLGGTSRFLVGELGVHQFFSGSDSADAAAPQSVTTAMVQYTTADIIGILNEFETPVFLYEKMFGTTEIYYVDATEKRSLNLRSDVQEFVDVISMVDTFLIASPLPQGQDFVADQPTATENNPIVPSLRLDPATPVVRLEDQALELLASINSDWSMPNWEALERVGSYYSEAVNFYGNEVTRFDVHAEKTKFAERWPVRQYRVDPARTTVSCSTDTCWVDTVIYWNALSPERGKEASGISTWSLVLRQSADGLKIIEESGETIKKF
jgi:hypothetical protein